MAETFRGLYRAIAWAYVTNGAMAFRVPEAEYRALGYEPDYDHLPWKDRYSPRAVTAAGAAPAQAVEPNAGQPASL